MKKSLFVEVGSLTPARIVELADQVHAAYQAGQIYNLALTNICDDDGNLYTAQLDALQPYLPGGIKKACDNVFVGSAWKQFTPDLYGLDKTQWFNHYAVWGGVLADQYRADQIELSATAWQAFKQRYQLPWMHFYLSNESDLHSFAHPILGAQITEKTEWLLIDLCKTAKGIEPFRSVLWSPFCWTPYRQIPPAEQQTMATRLTRLFSNVQSYSGMGINFLDLQDGVGARPGITTPQDAAALHQAIKPVYGFASQRMNVELYTTTPFGFTPTDTTAREEYYSDQGILPGACWEVRYANLAPIPTPAPTPVRVEYLSRAQWGARTDLPRLGYFVPAARRTELHIHHTAAIDPNDPTPNRWTRAEAVGYMRRLQTARPDLGLDIPYSRVHFVLEDLSVLICEGRGEMRSGAHTAGHNTAGFGWAVGGNFDLADQDAQIAFLAVVENEARYLRSAGFPNLCTVNNPRGWDVWGHRDTAPKSCPGNTLYWKLATVEVV